MQLKRPGGVAGKSIDLPCVEFPALEYEQMVEARAIVIAHAIGGEGEGGRVSQRGTPAGKGFDHCLCGYVICLHAFWGGSECVFSYISGRSQPSWCLGGCSISAASQRQYRVDDVCNYHTPQGTRGVIGLGLGCYTTSLTSPAPVYAHFFPLSSSGRYSSPFLTFASL